MTGGTRARHVVFVALFSFARSGGQGLGESAGEPGRTVGIANTYEGIDWGNDYRLSLAKGSALLAMAAIAALPDAFAQSSRERFFLEQYLGEPQFEVQQIFTGERFPNVVVTKQGTVLATWGRERYKVRRSEDGGATWGPEVVVADPGFHGGGVTVDERTGNIFVFVEDGHPPAPLTVYRSSDDGKTWQEVEVTIHPDPNDEVPSMHMNERGITLRHGEHAGRLLRPARVYMGANSYNSAIYSDDGGQTWHASAPFPVPATGEGAVAELSDGRIHYNSRRSRDSRMRWIAWSHDGGETWVDPVESDVLPDGPKNVDYGLMAGLVRLPLSGYDILLFSNVDSPGKPEGNTANWSERRRGTVWASFDGGETWPISRLVYEGPFAYSSLAAGRAATPSQGKIFLQFEGGPNGPHSDGHIVRFNLSWVMQGLVVSATGTLDRAKAMLENAEIGDEPGQHRQWAATRLELAIDALEEALQGISFPELIEKPERIRELQDLEAALEQEMVRFEHSIVRDGEVVFVNDGVPWAVEAIGTEWELGEGYLYYQGTGNCLVTVFPLMEGDFHIRATLSLDQLDGTAASFVFDVGPPENSFGGSHFGFDSRQRHLFVEGGFFGPTKSVGIASDHIEDGVPFLYEAVREGEVLALSLDGEEIYQQDIGDGPIGLLGLRPWRAGMRVYQFSATGQFDGLPVQPPGGFSAWRETYFSPDELADPALSGPTGSIAADRITNFMRYAFGLDPTESALRRLPKAGFTSNSGIDFLTLTYRRLRKFSDILYLAEATSELGGAWTPLGPDREIDVADNGDGTDSVTVRDIESVDENPRRFMRLRVEFVE